MAITLSILNRFSKFFSLLERVLNFQQKHMILPTVPSVCCRTTLRN